MAKGKIAVIGDRDTALAFKAVGADVFSTLTDEQTAERIKRLVKENYEVIFITEEKAEGLTELIMQYKSMSYPIIVPIPSARGSLGLGLNGLKYNIEKSIGTDIVFNREENK